MDQRRATAIAKEFGEKFLEAFHEYLILKKYSRKKADQWMRNQIYKIALWYFLVLGHEQSKSETLARLAAQSVILVIQDLQKPPNSWSDFNKLLELKKPQILKQLDTLFTKSAK